MGEGGTVYRFNSISRWEILQMAEDSMDDYCEGVQCRSDCRSTKFSKLGAPHQNGSKVAGLAFHKESH